MCDGVMDVARPTQSGQSVLSGRDLPVPVIPYNHHHHYVPPPTIITGRHQHTLSISMLD